MKVPHGGMPVPCGGVFCWPAWSCWRGAFLRGAWRTSRRGPCPTRRAWAGPGLRPSSSHHPRPGAASHCFLNWSMSCLRWCRRAWPARRPPWAWSPSRRGRSRSGRRAIRWRCGTAASKGGWWRPSSSTPRAGRGMWRRRPRMRRSPRRCARCCRAGVSAGARRGRPGGGRAGAPGLPFPDRGLKAGRGCPARAAQGRRNTTSQTPWPSLRPRFSNLVSGR